MLFRSLFGGFVERYRFCLAGLFLDNVYAAPDAVLLEIIDVVPGQKQKIADPQRGMDAEDYEDPVAQLPFVQIILRESADLTLVSDWLSRRHS